MQVNAGSFLTAASPLAASTYNAGTLLTGTYIVNGGRMEIDGFGNHAAGEIVTNAANIVLNGTGALFVDAGGHTALKPLAANSGSFTIEGGYNFTSAGDLANAGSVTVGSGSTLTAGPAGANNYNQSAGTTNVEGTLAASNVNINGGTLMGAGTVTGDVTIASGAALLPGDGPSDPGTIDLDSLTLAGTLDEVLTSAGFGVTNVGEALVLNADADDVGELLDTGIVNLDGTLDILLLDGYVPAVGTQFFFIDSPTVDGVFSTVNGSIIDGDEYFAVIYNPDSVELCVEATGSSVCGASTPSVPEPGSIFLMAGALLSAGWCGRKRRLKAY
jgi:fibronectin-binding autotransporter adhesin